jgi:hypothetical protein
LELGINLEGQLDGLIDELANNFELSSAKTAGSHSGGSQTDSTRNEGTGVAWDGVLVAIKRSALHNLGNTGTIDVLRAKVNKKEMVLGTAANEGVTASLELVGKGKRVLDNLILVGLELLGGSLLQRNADTSDDVVVGTSLKGRENSTVNAIL